MENKGEKFQDVEKFLWWFLLEVWNKEGILAAICLSEMCAARLRHCWMCEWDMVAIGVAKVVFAG